MGQLSNILRDTTDNGLMWWCPGCDEAHRIQHGEGLGPRWGWNGSVDKPTFTPSVLVRGVKHMTDEQHARFMATRELPDPEPYVCHSFVVDGQMQMLADCTHALAGKTVDIPALPDFWRDE